MTINGNMKAYFILRCTDVCGTVSFYTGKSGVEYVSQSEIDAFPYESLIGARRKAGVLNKMGSGWLFMPVGYIVNHGIVSASTLEDGFYGELDRATDAAIAKLHNR